MKYKVGDKVRIVNKRTIHMNNDGKMDQYLNTVMTIREVVNYSYRMEEDDGCWEWNDGDIVGKATIIKKSDLQNGDIVTYRNGAKRIVNTKKDGLAIIIDFDSIWKTISGYNEDLFDYDDKEGDLDVVKVYRPETEETFYTERTKKTKKMTVAEICKELGYDVEIIKENE